MRSFNSLCAPLLLAALSGCASLGGKVGAGRLEPATKAVVSSGAAAASLAAPEYAGLIKSVKDKALSYGEGADAIKLTEEQLSAVLRELGFSRYYTMYFDGVVVNDPARLSFREAWERTATGASVDPEAIVAAASSQAGVSALYARLDALADKLDSKLKAK